jgi:lipopolysaccharide transport system ATP-binding protein
MYVRLAFSVAIHVSPDILVVDEALAVGDAFFQARCMARMKRMLDDGITMLFISHDIAAVKALCNDVLWLERGRVRAWGPTDSVASQYTGLGVQANRLALTRPPEADARRRARSPAMAARRAQAARQVRRAAARCAGDRSSLSPVPADHLRSGDGRLLVAAGCRRLTGRRSMCRWPGRSLTIRPRSILAPCEQLIVSYHIATATSSICWAGTSATRRGCPHHRRPESAAGALEPR